MSQHIDDIKTYKYISDFDFIDFDNNIQTNNNNQYDNNIEDDTYDSNAITNIYFNIINYANQTYLPICEYLTIDDLNYFIDNNIL